MKKFNYRIVVFVIFQFFIFHSQLFSQFGLSGETVRGNITRRIDRGSSEYVHRLTYTAKIFQIATYMVKVVGNDEYRTGTSGQAPPEVEIVSANFKSNNPDIVFVLFSDGTVTIVQWKPSLLGGGSWKYSLMDRKKIFAANNYPFFRKIIGDAVYVLETGNVYASWDTAKTWKLDSTGLNGKYVADVAVDTNNYGWAATIDGLFYQHPDSALWNRNTMFPANDDYCQAIFVDRKNRMFVSTGSSSVYVSTDGGNTWTKNNTGLSGIVSSFGDDAFGNIYATTNDRAYRLSNLTPPWKNISDSMAAAGVPHSFTKLIYSIGGDSLLYAATKYGLLESTNAGTTWKYSNSQLPAFQFYGLVRFGNYYFVSTNLGIFRKGDSDSVFIKVYPAKGFVGNLKLYSDSAGNIYSTIPINPTSTVMYNFKSTDNGTTWIADTAGIKSLNLTLENGYYNVDAQGNQYAGKSGNFYSKSAGAAWKLDTTGLHSKVSGSITSISNNNKKGIVYAVKYLGFSKFALYKKVLNGTTWETIDISTISQSSVKIISDHNGDIILTTFDGKIFRYNGNVWTSIPKPTGIGGLPIIDQVIVDKNGVLWGSFFDGFTDINRGVRFTTDNGVTWKYAGLDSVGISFFATLVDSVFAVTFIDGIFTFTTSSTVGVENKHPRVATSYELHQNYPNPFNPNTNIRFNIPVSGFTTIKVYDVLGREVASLVDEIKESGSYTVTFDASKLSSGMYFYSIKSEKYKAVKKMSLIK